MPTKSAPEKETTKLVKVPASWDALIASAAKRTGLAQKDYLAGLIGAGVSMEKSIQAFQKTKVPRGRRPGSTNKKTEVKATVKPKAKK